MTQTQGKTQEVFESLWSSLGGSGANPDVPQFKSKLSSATPEQMIEAGGHLPQIVRHIGEEQNPPPRIVEEVVLICDDLVRRYQEAASGART